MCSALLFTLQVWMLLRYLWSNLLRIPIYLNNKPCVKNKLLALSCQEINQYVSCVRFFTSREGVVGFLPNFWAAFHPPLCHFVHPPKRWGVNTGSPEALDRSQQPESIWPVCELWVTFQSLTTPGWKHVNLQTLPRLQIRVAAEKRVECQVGRPVQFFPLMQFQFFDVSFRMSCLRTSFHLLAFAATSILKCITRWRTRRRRT